MRSWNGNTNTIHGGKCCEFKKKEASSLIYIGENENPTVTLK